VFGDDVRGGVGDGDEGGRAVVGIARQKGLVTGKAAT
jgi:hypothetical protein